MAGFAKDVAFFSKDGIQSFEELGEGARTVTKDRDCIFRKASTVKVGDDEILYKLVFTRGVYASTKTIIYASETQEWLCEDGEYVSSKDLEIGSKLKMTDGVVFNWKLIEKDLAGMGSTWSLNVIDGDTFMLRNEIPALSFVNNES